MYPYFSLMECSLKSYFTVRLFLNIILIFMRASVYTEWFKSKWTVNDNIYFEITFTIIFTNTIITLTIKFYCVQLYKSTKILSTQVLKLWFITIYWALKSNINDCPPTFGSPCICIYLEMIDCSESDSIVEICGKLAKSNT